VPNLPTDNTDTDDTDDISDTKRTFGDDNIAAIADIKCAVNVTKLKNIVKFRQITPSNPPSKACCNNCNNCNILNILNFYGGDLATGICPKLATDR